MTKSTITREQLTEWVSQLDSDDGCDATDRQLEALIRQSLAALDSEPVGEFYEDGPNNWYQISDGDRVPDSRRIPLYRHAQQPVVQPEVIPEWTNEQCLEFLSIAFRHAEIKGDLEMDDIRLGIKMVNASRAAMLQSGNSPAIPDGSAAAAHTGIPMIPDGYMIVPREPTAEMIAAAMDCDDVLFNRDETFCVQFGNIYAAMLAAAPQEATSARVHPARE